MYIAPKDSPKWSEDNNEERSLLDNSPILYPQNWICKTKLLTKRVITRIKGIISSSAMANIIRGLLWQLAPPLSRVGKWARWPMGLASWPASQPYPPRFGTVANRPAWSGPKNISRAKLVLCGPWPSMTHQNGTTQGIMANCMESCQFCLIILSN